ncbi:hypothetical protein HPB47_012722 [Ixodes persulcatus]|uniref:Uncharacterized protein n=1 Tax=Ixodes persulcatus TaxID=34615 RepID=A0AC60NSQ9_IXOPE|nr:hypothetical protein HPB47_012722 [Ixodes persulcatus]
MELSESCTTPLSATASATRSEAEESRVYHNLDAGNFSERAAGKAKYADLSKATVQDVSKRWLWSFVNRDVRYLTDEELEELLKNSDADLSDVEEEYTVPQGVRVEEHEQQEEFETPRRRLLTNYEYFQKYFPEDFWVECALQTNLYSIQKRNHCSLKTAPAEVKKLAGIHMLMGVMHVSQVHLYWSRACSIPLVSESMTRNRLYELRSHLHFVYSAVPTDEQKQDKLFLVRPILSAFSSACLALPRTRKLAVDEQMILFSGRCAMRQYLPSKPNPLGLKNFVLAAPDGLVLDYVIYTGKNTVPEEDIKTYGLGGAVVKRLVEPLDAKEIPTLLFTDR